MKKGVSLLLMLALVISCISVPIQAADEYNGYWVLVNHETKIIEPDNSYGVNYDNLKYDYDESTNTIYYSKDMHLSNIDGTFNGNMSNEIKLLTPSVKAGEEIRFNVISKITGSMDNMIYQNVCVINEKDCSLYWRDVDDYSHYWITAKTGPNNVEVDSAIVERCAPERPKEGDIFEIEVKQQSGDSSCGLITTVLTFKYTSNVNTAPGKTSIKSTKIKKNILTVTVKSIKCDGYQIQVSNSNDFTSNTETTLKTLTYFGSSNKATFDNKMLNKTKYIRVRAFYKDGENLTFGEWSKVKKLTK